MLAHASMVRFIWQERRNMVGRRIVRQVIYAGLSGCKHVTTPFYSHQIPAIKRVNES